MRSAAILLSTAALAIAGCAAAPPPEPAAASPAVAAEAQPVRYSARDFFETTSYGLAGSPRYAFSPDGRAVLISSDQTGVFNAYRLPNDGGAAAPLTTSTDNATFAISFFPNDERVLVTADRGGNELNHVYVRERDGTLRDLTPGERHKAQFVGWSGDGRTFWIATNERNPQMFDLYAY
ncbi:MAG: S9 family peptidase, partial [Pseudomonadota bacterium]|nr:S9 family peptidase [Pseudomonadota bacterium]